MKTLCTSIALILSASMANAANYKLNNERSDVYFSSTKKGVISEVHHFKTLSGMVDENGNLTFEIDLSSVETNISIRNERMAKLFFEVTQFAKATVTSALDLKQVSALAAGEFLSKEVSIELDLHGVKKQLNVELQFVGLKHGAILVNSKQPIMLNVKDFNLVDNLNQLQTLAGLPSIDSAVPVTLNLVFTPK